MSVGWRKRFYPHLWSPFSFCLIQSAGLHPRAAHSDQMIFRHCNCRLCGLCMLCIYSEIILNQSGSQLDWQLRQVPASATVSAGFICTSHHRPPSREPISDSRGSIITLWRGSWCINFVIVRSCNVWVSSGDVEKCKKGEMREHPHLFSTIHPRTPSDIS